MDINKMFCEDEKPLDQIVIDGGFTGIFRTIACIGDSLSSGEFESLDENNNRGYHDMFEYSWGQFIARAIGSKVYNFSRGGMTAREYIQSFAENMGFWSHEKAAQAYIIALGVNDVTEAINQNTDLGNISDIAKDYKDNKPTFFGYYAAIVQRIKEIQPDAKFFFMTIPKSYKNDSRSELEDRHAEIIYELSDYFDKSYVIDLRKYSPIHDEDFHDKFYMSGHLNPCGYLLAAQMVMSYIDFIIRHNMNDFRKVGFIGTPFVNVDYQ